MYLQLVLEEMICLVIASDMYLGLGINNNINKKRGGGGGGVQITGKCTKTIDVLFLFLAEILYHDLRPIIIYCI